MLGTFAKMWPGDIKLLFYREDHRDLPSFKNVEYRELPDWHYRWKARHKDHPDAHGRNPKRNRRGRGFDFRRDCVRFSHKVAALTDAAAGINEGWLIWYDADIVTHERVDREWLLSLVPRERYLSWLARRNSHPECGFMIFRAYLPQHKIFMAEMRRIYESDDVFKENETHDSYIFQKVAERLEAAGQMESPFNLSGEHCRTHHPFVACRLGERLDHLKGRRKGLGRSPEGTTNKRRKEPHWKRRSRP